MEPGSSTAATSETTTSQVQDERRSNRRDAACQTTTDDPFLGPEESGPAMKRTKVFEPEEQTETGPDDDEMSQKKSKQSGWSSSRPAGMPLSAPEIKAVAAKLLDRSRMKEELESRRQRETAASSAGGGCSDASPAVATVVDRPLPMRFPPWPKNATRKAIREWNLEDRRIEKLVAEDPLTKLLENLPTRRKPKDPGTRDAVASSRDKDMVLHVARSIVNVSSIGPDGKVIWPCTGIVVGWDEAKKCSRILYHILCDIGTLLDPKPKIHVCLPNTSVSEGQLLFFNEYYSPRSKLNVKTTYNLERREYNIVLLEITTDFALQLPSFGSSPNYGKEVFVLARDKESFLSARRGIIMWRDELGLRYHATTICFSAVNSLGGLGGPVIDHDVNVIGMASGYASEDRATALVPISTVLTCIEMWMKFSRIARPIMHDLSLRSVELLDVSSREKISYTYNINSGYIVDMVRFNSTAEKVGIRRGDVIVSFYDLGVQHLPKLEDLLLSLGWEFLERGLSANTVVDFKLEVYDPIGHCTRSMVLPVGFCDAQADEC